METNQVRQNHNSGQVNGKKVFFWTLGIAGAGAGGYLLWDYLRRRKAQADAASYQPPMVQNIYLPASGSGSKTATTRTDNFPLKRGSKGERVRQLQLALQRILGTTGLAKYTEIDGDYGSGTEDAVRAAGLSTSMDETTFNRLIGVGAAKSSIATSVQPGNYYGIADELFMRAEKRDLQGVLNTLSKIRNVNDYTQVSDIYRKLSKARIDSTQTVVGGLLDYAFQFDEAAKIPIRAAFKTIGLYESGGKWSTTPPMLSGFKRHKDIITLVGTYVQDKKGNRIAVRKNIILGEEQYTANGMTFFKSIDQGEFAVPARDVKYV